MSNLNAARKKSKFGIKQKLLLTTGYYIVQKSPKTLKKLIMKINLVDAVSENCFSIDDGQTLFDLVFPELKEGRSVEIDFNGVKSVLTPFLHSSIGKLLESFAKEAVMEKLVFCNISQEQLKQVNNYINRIDQEQLQSSSRDSLRELFEEDELGDIGL
jgi:hypothetical protein